MTFKTLLIWSSRVFYTAIMELTYIGSYIVQLVGKSNEMHYSVLTNPYDKPDLVLGSVYPYMEIYLCLPHFFS